MDVTTNDELQKLQAELVEACRMGDQPLVDAIVAEITAVVESLPSEDVQVSKPMDWNNDPKWLDYVQRLDSVIVKIATKYTTDEALREDCAQEARISLYTLHPTRLKGAMGKLHEQLVAGEIAESVWLKQLSKYCRNVARNSVLSYLDSLKTGSWYIGRSRRVRNRKTGERSKTHVGARYSSLEELVDSGLQVDTEGHVTWDVVTPGMILREDLPEDK